MNDSFISPTFTRRRNMEKYAWKWIGMLLFVALISSFVTVAGPDNAWARKKESAFEKQIQGSWTLVSCINEQDGKKIDVFDPNPRGTYIITPDGRFSQILMNASLPKFASNSRVKGTPEEYQGIVQGSVAYFGSYKVTNEKENVVMHIEGSTFPNWDGGDQKRIVTIMGDEMKVVNPTPTIGSGTNYIIWKRVK